MDWLRSGIFLLLVTASARGDFEKEDIHIHLEPTTTIKVHEEASIQISCFFTPIGQYKVSWHFSSQTNLSKCGSDKIGEETSFIIELNNSCSTLTSTSIRTTETGWYFCKVIKDIPFLQQWCSDGLHVLVEANSVCTQGPNHTQSTTNSPTTCSPNAFTSETPSPPAFPVSIFDQWWIWVALAGGCVILIVSVVVTRMLACRKASKEIIYENTPSRKSGGWRRTQMDSCNLPASKKVETIKPLRKYDTLSQIRVHRP